MTLLDNLYTATPAGENEYLIELNPEHTIYKAHFPGRPITPGVCLVQMVGEVVSMRIGRKLKLMCVKNAKFISPIEPALTPAFTLSLLRITIADTVSVQATLRQETTVLAKMSLRYD